ncbi:MAG: quinoprotein relay system zinc metallohydrolase 2 [Hyphomicrobiales bacterium]|nr:quinoprotein relay system zinc metallohydrolase 2 [Hyphomicrobiales bacterium]
MLRCIVIAFVIFIHDNAKARDANAAFVREIAPGVYAHQGAVALMNAENRGDIANIGFVVGEKCVAVIDAGGSLEVGRALLAALRQITDKPICFVVNTHVHPDHIFGDGAFVAPGVTFVGHKNLPRALAQRGAFYKKSFRPMIGALADEAVIVTPTLTVDGERTLDLGGRALTVRSWRTAHTDNDVSVFDTASGVIFTGDLVFLRHTPVVDGSLLGFLSVVGDLEKIPAKLAVPGHGPIGVDWPAALQAEKTYLETLTKDLRRLVKSGERVDRAAQEAAQSEKSKWSLFDDYNPRNATAGFAELEWE